MQKLKMHSPDITQANIAHIRTRFPNCVTEAHDANGNVVYKVDFDLLRQELAGEIVEGPQERYRLDWPGKRQAMLAANAPTVKSLRPCREESVDFDTTENLYIEGDNLEVLKLLQESYLGKVKMIYIDPPYNTGHDFIYKDTFAEHSADFLQRDGQFNDAGERMVLNLESNGRRHSDWLSMIYQRLRIAKNLLANDGVIFISIDDNEFENLKKICNDIFGNNNYRNSIFTKRYEKNINRQFMENGLSSMNIGLEYILMYSKMQSTTYNPVFRESSEERSRFGYWKGFWNDANRPTMRYDIFGVIPSSGQWKWKKEVADEAIANYVQYIDCFSQKMTLEKYWESTGRQKKFIRRNSDGKGKNQGIEHWVAPSDSILRNTNWSDLLASKSTGVDIPFDSPKNVEVITELLRLSNIGNDGIVVDFFSGSATTAHAVIQLNSEDDGKRKFIMTQLPEACPSDSEAAQAGYKNICEIGKERIRRAGKKIKEEKPLVTQNLDTGFRVLKVKSSCMEDVYYTPDKAKQSLLLYDNIKIDTTPEDLLFQVLTDWGVELHLPIAVKTIKDKKVFFVDENSLVACFERDIDDDFIKEVAGYKPIRVVFRDSGFANDAARINAEQIFKQLSPDTEVRVL